MTNNKPTNDLDKILSKCEFADTPAINEDNICYIQGQHPTHCPYMIYYIDDCYCKSILVRDETKQKQYAKWMEE